VSISLGQPAVKEPYFTPHLRLQPLFGPEKNAFDAQERDIILPLATWDCLDKIILIAPKNQEILHQIEHRQTINPLLILPIGIRPIPPLSIMTIICP